MLSRFFKRVEKETNAQKLENAGFPYDDIPLEFIDFCFSYEIMDNPVKLDNQHIMDYNNLKKWWEQSGRNQINPITNTPLIKLELLSDLKATIDEFVKRQIDTYQALTKEFEEKIEQRRFERQQQIQALKETLEKYQRIRQEFVKQIEQEIGDNDDPLLKILLENIDRIDRKIHKLTLGHAYHNDPQLIKKRIDVILIKQEKSKLSEKEELKLNTLLQKLGAALERKSRIISRFGALGFFPQPSLTSILTLEPDHLLRRNHYE